MNRNSLCCPVTFPTPSWKKETDSCIFNSAPKQIPISKWEVSYYTSYVPPHQREGRCYWSIQSRHLLVRLRLCSWAPPHRCRSSNSIHQGLLHQSNASTFGRIKWRQDNNNLQTSLCAALWVLPRSPAVSNLFPSKNTKFWRRCFFVAFFWQWKH